MIAFAHLPIYKRYNTTPHNHSSRAFLVRSIAGFCCRRRCDDLPFDTTGARAMAQYFE